VASYTAAAGSVFQVPFHFGRSKSGFIGIYGPTAGTIFGVTVDWGKLQSQAFSSGNFSNQVAGSIPLTAPSGAGAYKILTVVPADGGTLGVDDLTVTAAAAAAPPASSAPPVTPAGATPPSNLNPWQNAPAGVYIPPVPEPAASDGAKLSQQGTDLQAYYVATYGPGMLAATQFVIDHEHQLQAIGSSTHPATTYTAPANEPAASDGEKLSMQSADVQAYYVNKYGPGFLAAVGFVNERNASLGTSIPGGASTVLPLPAGGGAPVDAGGTDWSTVSNQTPPAGTGTTAQGQPAPSIGGLLQQAESNPMFLVVGGVALFFLFGGGFGHRR
jgi:hypothetical protein